MVFCFFFFNLSYSSESSELFSSDDSSDESYKLYFDSFDSFLFATTFCFFKGYFSDILLDFVESELDVPDLVSRSFGFLPSLESPPSYSLLCNLRYNSALFLFSKSLSSSKLWIKMKRIKPANIHVNTLANFIRFDQKKFTVEATYGVESNYSI